MSLKHRLYKKLKELSATKYGVFAMMLISFLESCVLPITPLVMLIPMILMHKDKALRYVNLATIAAMFGSIIGYFLGFWLMQYIEPYIASHGYTQEFIKVQDWFEVYGLLVLLPASILPFPPFKVFTIAAGAMRLKFLPFIIVVFIVRWIHFVIVPFMMYCGKKAYLYKYEDNLTGTEP